MQRLCFPIGLERNAGNALKIKKSRNWLPFPVVPHTRHAIPHTHWYTHTHLVLGGLSICVHWPLWLRFDFCRHEKQRKVCETFSCLPNCWAKFFGFSFALFPRLLFLRLWLWLWLWVCSSGIRARKLLHLYALLKVASATVYRSNQYTFYVA